MLAAKCRGSMPGSQTRRALWLHGVPPAVAVAASWGFVTYDLARPDGQPNLGYGLFSALVVLAMGVLLFSYLLARVARGAQRASMKAVRLRSVVTIAMFSFLWGSFRT